MFHTLVSSRIAGRIAPPLPSPAPTSAPAVSFQTILNQQTPAPTVAAPSTPSLHDVAALPNGGRMVNPTGMNALTGGTIPYNPDYYATEQAAAQLAKQLGGTVVDLRGQISNNQAEYFIDLPNGTTINAGNLLGVLNNAVFQENSRVMDGQIAQLLNNNAVGSTNVGTGLFTVRDGHVTYDPTANT
jgi:hypothetical protein